MIIKHLEDASEILSGDQAHLRELFNPRKETLQFGYSLAWALVEPAKKTTPHTLTYSEVYYILQGTGIIHVGEHHADVRAHDAIYIPPHEVQWIENTNNQSLIFLCIVDPAWHPEAEQVLEEV
jgi:mannose-6-phosphate isomerase-like protein (cupin superfamily)